MKKLLLFVLLIVLLLPSCAGLGLLGDKSFSMFMKGINIITKGSMMITAQVRKTIEDCKEKCKTNKEHSDEWCNCMDECYRLEYDSPDENIIFCLPDSTNSNLPELEEPKEQIEPEEGVIPEVPDVKTPKINMNILDGEINSGSTTLKTEDIIKDCKKECETFTISSDEWCDCMNQCSQKVFDKISFGDMNVKIYIEECP